MPHTRPQSKRTPSHSELLERAAAALTAAGLVNFEPLDVSGNLAMCGTTRKPHGTAGRYRLHMDDWPRVWRVNYHEDPEGRTINLYEPGEVDRLSPAEKAALRERVAREKAAALQAREKAQKAAAQRAGKLLEALPPAGTENAYLTRKGVPPMPGLRQDEDGLLVVPVLDAAGKTASLQRIDADGGKRFMPGPLPSAYYFPIPAKDGSKTGPLCIAEGYATAASLHLATGHACLVAFSAGNLEAVARMAREKYPERPIVLCADFDDQNPAHPEPGGTGVALARKAAAATGARLAICPAIDGAKADFNDLHQKRGLVAVQRAVEAALEGGAEPLPEKLPSGFSLRTGKLPGLWYEEPKDEGDPVSTWICAPLEVLGATRDENGGAWGLLLQWKDADGRTHSWAMPKSHLAGRDSSAVLERLADGGLRFSFGKRAKDLFGRFLTEYQTRRRICCVPRTGWHGGAFVLPDETFYAQNPLGRLGRVGQAASGKDLPPSQSENKSGTSGTDEQIVLQTRTPGNPFRTAGTLDGWRDTVGAWAAGNSRLMLAVCAAFAAPLLEMCGMESGGFNYSGQSSSGKTTALVAAASVWGRGASSGGFVQNWRATSNGLEGMAALYSDSLLCLDEIGQAPGRTVQEAAYMLGNGTGKARALQDGSARAVKSWRCFILSTGEIGLAEKIREEGGRARAGQEVRLVDIPADAGAGMGIFEDLHGHAGPQAFADALKHAAATHYGHAARAFIRALQAEREKAGAELARFMERGVEDFCPADADGQVRRVARRFLLCAGAGEMAAGWGLVPWEQGAAVTAARICFEAWLAQRGGAGAAEDRAILEAVRLFLEQRGQSRFQNVDRPDAVCVNRVGFRQADETGTTFYVLPESFRAEVCKGHDAKRAAAVLRDAGMLRPDGKRLKRWLPTLPGIGRQAGYILTTGAQDELP